MEATARAEALAAYAADTGCVRCQLAETRTQVVFGSDRAELMIVGEAPAATKTRVEAVRGAGRRLSTPARGNRIRRDSVSANVASAGRRRTGIVRSGDRRM
jgi:uracil-DNA glycosylase